MVSYLTTKTHLIKLKKIKCQKIPLRSKLQRKMIHRSFFFIISKKKEKKTKGTPQHSLSNKSQNELITPHKRYFAVETIQYSILMQIVMQF